MVIPCCIIFDHYFWSWISDSGYHNNTLHFWASSENVVVSKPYLVSSSTRPVPIVNHLEQIIRFAVALRSCCVSSSLRESSGLLVVSCGSPHNLNALFATFVVDRCAARLDFGGISHLFPIGIVSANGQSERILRVTRSIHMRSNVNCDICYSVFTEIKRRYWSRWTTEYECSNRSIHTLPFSESMRILHPASCRLTADCSWLIVTKNPGMNILWLLPRHPGRMVENRGCQLRRTRTQHHIAWRQDFTSRRDRWMLQIWQKAVSIVKKSSWCFCTTGQVKTFNSNWYQNSTPGGAPAHSILNKHSTMDVTQWWRTGPLQEIPLGSMGRSL